MNLWVNKLEHILNVTSSNINKYKFGINVVVQRYQWTSSKNLILPAWLHTHHYFSTYLPASNVLSPYLHVSTSSLAVSTPVVKILVTSLTGKSTTHIGTQYANRKKYIAGSDFLYVL